MSSHAHSRFLLELLLYFFFMLRLCCLGCHLTIGTVLECANWRKRDRNLAADFLSKESSRREPCDVYFRNQLRLRLLCEFRQCVIPSRLRLQSRHLQQRSASDTINCDCNAWCSSLCHGNQSKAKALYSRCPLADTRWPHQRHWRCHRQAPSTARTESCWPYPGIAEGSRPLTPLSCAHQPTPRFTLLR